MLFPINDLRDETACYELLLSVLPPKGLRCPEGHDLPADRRPARPAPRAGGGLPLPRVRQGLQRLHGDGAARRPLLSGAAGVILRGFVASRCAAGHSCEGATAPRCQR